MNNWECLVNINEILLNSQNLEGKIDLQAFIHQLKKCVTKYEAL